jgi:adenylylsulfate kinase-like enzyme
MSPITWDDCGCYEGPATPELVVDTASLTLDACFEQVIDYLLHERGILRHSE